MNEVETVVDIDGINYKWKISREPQWCHDDGWQGVQISVELEKDPKKILLLKLPFEVSSRKLTPHKQRPKIEAKEVEKYISKAIEEGWKPSSKGKPFKYEV